MPWVSIGKQGKLETEAMSSRPLNAEQESPWGTMLSQQCSKTVLSLHHSSLGL